MSLFELLAGSEEPAAEQFAVDNLEWYFRDFEVICELTVMLMRSSSADRPLNFKAHSQLMN